MSDAVTLQKVKKALQIAYSDFDTTIDDLIDAAVADLGIAGITGESVALSDPLVLNAVISYVAMNWSETKDYQRYKDAYETQKGQLWAASSYTDWSGMS